jgi:ABC-type uncharacterized transport system substrate-binding protein
MCFGQVKDLAEQIDLVKQILPNATRFGIVYPNDGPSIEDELSVVINRLGLMVIKTPVNSIRDIPGACRSMIGTYGVDFIYVVNDPAVAGKSGIKFMVKQSRGHDVPVFTEASSAFSGGALGQFVTANEVWVLRINSEVRGEYTISIPDNTSRIVVE